jgi:phosphoribosylformylglycinamidine (FGAM) synthase PurS component
LVFSLKPEVCGPAGVAIEKARRLGYKGA